MTKITILEQSNSLEFKQLKTNEVYYVTHGDIFEAGDIIICTVRLDNRVVNSTILSITRVQDCNSWSWEIAPDTKDRFILVKELKVKAIF